MPISRRATALVVALALTACGDGGSGPSNPALCTAPTAIGLAVAESRVIDPIAETSCLGLLGGAQEREYLVVPYAGQGEESSAGVTGGYQLLAQPGAIDAPVAATSRLVSPLAHQRSGADFHHQLRLAESALARGPLPALNRVATAAALRLPPTFGEEDQFRVCLNGSCTNTASVTATVRYVGERGIVYLDNDVPTGAEQLTQADFDHLGTLFDNYLHPIDTAAFGAVSDIDGDERIAILITPRVNDLSPDCTDGRVVGYFYGGDLLFSSPGSNQREVFFAFAPKPATQTCSAVTRTMALKSLPPVLIHELQHMISFNEHVLKRGQRDEAVWLNEGLSHFAEELGQRLIPDEHCPASSSCFTEFASGNIQNAYLFLEDPEGSYLVAPAGDGPGVSDRGAAWLFVRWLADHFATSENGREVTRGLLQRGTPGAANVEGITGVPFDRLVGEWLQANWLDNLEGFPQSGRNHYKSWNFRSLFLANYPGVFSRPYPLIPDLASGNFARTGTLRGGSGPYLRVVVPSGANQIVVRLADRSGVVRISSHLKPRIAVTRIR